MKIGELIEKLEGLAEQSDARGADPEELHDQADKLLLDFIDVREVRDAYDAIVRWCA